MLHRSIETAPFFVQLDILYLHATDQTQKHRNLKSYISPPESFRTKEGSVTANIS